MLSLTSEIYEIQLDYNYSTPVSFRTIYIKLYLEEYNTQNDLATVTNNIPVTDNEPFPDIITIKVLEYWNPAYTWYYPNKLTSTDINLYLNDNDFSTLDDITIHEFNIFAYIQ